MNGQFGPSTLLARHRLWRMAGLLLMLIAFSGPWAFDRIHVPLPFECAWPNVRLDEAFCGVPVTFASFALVFVSNGIEVIRYLTSGEARAGEFLLIAILLLYLFPVANSLLLVGRGNRRRWQMAQIAVLMLTAVVSVLFAVFGVARAHLALWGIWVYTGVVIAIVVGETIAYRAGRRADSLRIAS